MKTIRVLSKGPAPSPSVAGLKAAPLSDMQVDLSWRIEPRAARVSHYHVYRGATADFKPGC